MIGVGFIWTRLPTSHSQQSVLRVFFWINQSDIFILNRPIVLVSNCNPLDWNRPLDLEEYTNNNKRSLNVVFWTQSISSLIRVDRPIIPLKLLIAFIRIDQSQLILIQPVKLIEDDETGPQNLW